MADAANDERARAEWQAAVARVLKRADSMETLTSRTRDGLAIQPLYAPATMSGRAPWREAVGTVGVVQRVDHPDSVEAGRLAVIDAANGATELALVLSGAASARSFGLPDHFDALSTVLSGLDPAGVAIRFEFPPFAGLDLVERVLAEAERQGHGSKASGLDLAADPLGDAARTGLIPVGNLEAKGLVHVTDRWVDLLHGRGIVKPILRADGRPHHEAGASEAQELAAVLSSGVSYLRALEGVGLDDAALAFTLAADADQILTVAKFRALRRLWARVQEACGLAPKPIRLHGETAWRMLARKDPWTNLLRNTVACAGAILGGADSVTVLPFTSALGLPDAFARRLARNTPLVLLEESNLARVADPCAGSGAFEALTDSLCREAWRLFQDLEVEGGLSAALVSGTWQAKVAAVRQARHADLAAGKTRLVGVTAFALINEALPEVLRPALSEALVSTPGRAGLRFAPLPSVRDAAPSEDDAPLPRSPGGAAA